MKSLAIVGMLFLSMGLFAQSPGAESPVKSKDKVCLKKCDKRMTCDKMVKAPIREVDVRKSTLRTEGAQSKKVKIQKNQLILPVEKKSARIDEKM